MKKNRMMRLASTLLVLTLLTTCAISGTFAKYTTQATASDTARVAYWGFEQTAIENFELFNANDEGILNSGDGLLAPGSKGSATITFVYTDNSASTIQAPEVDYTFKIEVATTGAGGTGAADIDALDNNENFLWVLDGIGYQKFADFKSAVEALDGDATKYEAGTLPEAFYTKENNEYVDNKTHTIGWEWLFDGNATTNLKDASGNAIIAKTDNDAVDTAMGNADDLDDLAFSITITATQVD